MIYFRKTLLIFFCFVFIKSSFACKCDQTISVADGLKYSDIVFSGKIISVEHTTDYKLKIVIHGDTTSSLNRITYYPLQIIKIKVNRFYKGNVEVDTITIVTGNNSASCGYRFVEGQNYVVYGTSESYFSNSHYSIRGATTCIYWTNRCSRTEVFSTGEEEEILSNLK